MIDIQRAVFELYTSRSFPHSWLITGSVTRLTRRGSLVKLTLLEHLSSSSLFSGVRVTRSLVLCVCFENHCLFFNPFSFDYCVVCPSICGFWLPLWYLQTLLASVVLGLWLRVSDNYSSAIHTTQFILRWLTLLNLLVNDTSNNGL